MVANCSTDSLKLTTAKKLADFQKKIGNKERLIKSWVNFENLNDPIERLSFPMAVGDAYDTGLINEAESQRHVFQGTLAHLNKYD